jgi:two-component system OmpR family response regulator
MRVLLIEDDRRLTAIMKKVLTAEKMMVDIAHDGDMGVEMALQGNHDVAVIDWMLPGRDGPAVCQAIRSGHQPLPILMLTARSQVEDRVAGLYSGADDYLVKPFSFDELIARIHALARRWNEGSAAGWELRAGNLVMDLRTKSARRRDRSLDLTLTEWNLLECFMRHPNQTLSRQAILNYVWQDDAGVQVTLVDVYVSYLRNKLKVDGLQDPIITRRGFGYTLESKNA